MLKDLERDSSVLKNNPKSQPDGTSTVGLPTKSSTSTKVIVVPLTAPLVRALARERVEETAFKEKWSEQKKAEALQSDLKDSTDQLTGEKQCFRMNLETPFLDATEMKHWHGKVVQDQDELELTFSKGSGYAKVTTNSSVNTIGGTAHINSFDTTEYFYTTVACTKKPIELARTFKLILEPRYDKELVPLELAWTDGQKTKK